MIDVSETRYAKTPDGVHIAYRVMGEGPDLVVVPDGPIPIDSISDEPHFDKFVRHLARFNRLVLFDRRGIGLSDPVTSANPPTLENWVDDALAVLDAVGSTQAAALGMAEGGFIVALLAATRPERISKVVFINATPGVASPRVEERGLAERLLPDLASSIDDNWGGDAALLDNAIAAFAPSMVGDNGFRSWLSRADRRAMSPAGARAMFDVLFRSDITDVLPSVRVPTLVLHRAGNRFFTPAHGRFLAEAIREARYVEVPGADHVPYLGDTEPIIAAIEEFLTGGRVRADADRVLATIMFTDIVASTERAVELGDRRWRDLLDDHHRLIRDALQRFRGQEIKTTGDGFLAIFDGPARAIWCASAIRDAVRALDLRVRAGLHTGEVNVQGGDIGGIAVHIAQRVAAFAEPSEVLVSSTVKDLVAGSGIEFLPRGSHTLKGMPGTWQLLAVASATDEPYTTRP